MSMKTVMKKTRRTEEEKKENLMSKMNKLVKTRARGDFQYNTYNNRNDDEY